MILIINAKLWLKQMSTHNSVDRLRPNVYSCQREGCCFLVVKMIGYANTTTPSSARLPEKISCRRSLVIILMKLIK